MSRFDPRIGHAERPCNEAYRDGQAGDWICTLPAGHDGEHVASDGLRIMATWTRPRANR